MRNSDTRTHQGRLLAVILSSLGLGCAPDDRGGDSGLVSSSSGGGSGSDSGSGSGDNSGETGDGDGDGSGDDDSGGPPGTGGPGGDGDGDGIKFDIGDGGDGSGAEGGGGQGCEKIDFLFVIDNSGSMDDNQENLANSFPGFIDAIESNVDATDYHIMVVDSDADGSISQCNGQTCGFDFPHPPCCGPEPGCEGQIGSGRIAGAGGDCGVVGGRRYMTRAQPNLTSTFACAARVGTNGSANELPMTGMRFAVSEERNTTGGCNEGFLRDDAILVVTVVTDATVNTANFEHNGGSAAVWRDWLVQAKKGNEQAIVFIGLFGDNDVAGGICGADANGSHSPEFRALAESFGPRGFLGSVCSPDYSPLFAGAIATIDTTCDEFVPVG